MPVATRRFYRVEVRYPMSCLAKEINGLIVMHKRSGIRTITEQEAEAELARADVPNSTSSMESLAAVNLSAEVGAADQPPPTAKIDDEEEFRLPETS